MDVETQILDDTAKKIQQAIDEGIMIQLLTDGWYKMELTFGKDRYHEHTEMEKWCHDNIGPGGWTWGTPKTWDGMDDKVWIMYSMFGNTTFAFKHQKHYNWFALRWI